MQIAMIEKSDTSCCYRIRLVCGTIGGYEPLSVRITLRSDDSGGHDVSIESEASDRVADGGATADGDIMVDIWVSPSMQSLLREEQRFQRAIASSLLKNVSLDDIAASCCLSVSTFKRRFRARYSTSPHRWFLAQRLKIAYTLILTTTVSISLIATICGFPNTSHFIAQFRRRYSITPMRLRDAASTATGSGDDISIEL